MSTSIYQIWGCIRCASRRIWGATICEDPRVAVFLFCDTCGKYLTHRFVKHYTMEEIRVNHPSLEGSPHKRGGSLSRSLPGPSNVGTKENESKPEERKED